MKKKLKKVRSLFFWEVDLGAATAAAGASSAAFGGLTSSAGASTAALGMLTAASGASTAAFGMLTAATAASLWLLRRFGCLGLAVVRETDLGVSALLGLLGFLGVFGLFPPLGGQSLEGEALAVMRLGVAEDRVDAIDQIAD